MHPINQLNNIKKTTQVPVLYPNNRVEWYHPVGKFKVYGVTFYVYEKGSLYGITHKRIGKTPNTYNCVSIQDAIETATQKIRDKCNPKVLRKMISEQPTIKRSK